MNVTKKSVTKVEFEKFIEDYPRPLEKDICGISDPPLVTYNDFTLGDWPNSVVASTYLYDDREGSPHRVESNQKYFISPDYEKRSRCLSNDPVFVSHIVFVPDAAEPINVLSKPSSNGWLSDELEYTSMKFEDFVRAFIYDNRCSIVSNKFSIKKV